MLGAGGAGGVVAPAGATLGRGVSSEFKPVGAFGVGGVCGDVDTGILIPAVPSSGAIGALGAGGGVDDNS